MCAISGVLVMSLPIPIIAGNFEKFHKTQAKKNKLLKRRAALVAAKENEEKVRFKLNYPWGKTIFMICSGENCGHLRPRQQLTSLSPAPGQESSAESADHEDLGLPEKLPTLRPHPAMRLSSVTRSANQRPVLAPLTNETPTPSDEANAAFVIICTRSCIFLNLNFFVKFAQNTNNQSMKELQTMKLNHVDVYNAYYEGRGMRRQ